ncbi:uncharacterized protein LOC126209953 [Schistocerca nitens]|uniref:uncharacterized protein LOC126209953 n=1 Tax=Schistocerca nitens TaxID=7011 RepID=UPI0021181B55|nr:uncharacterized protein LOC126209953 [Schistocerca nitens]
MEVDLTVLYPPDLVLEDLHQLPRVSSVQMVFPHKVVSITLMVQINGIPLHFQLDTESLTTIIDDDSRCHLGGLTLHPVPCPLKSFSNDIICMQGWFLVQVQCPSHDLTAGVFILLAPTATNLLGMDLFHSLVLEIRDLAPAVQTVSPDTLLQELFDFFPDVFSDASPEVSDLEVHVELLPLPVPKFHKARSVPLVLRDALHKELSHLEEAGVCVILEKLNGSLHICADFKATVNAQSIIDSYPIPKADDILSKLAGGKIFAKIDLREAYLQLLVNAPFQEVLVISTPFALFWYNHLPFGIASTPAILQHFSNLRIFDDILRLCWLQGCSATGPNVNFCATRLTDEEIAELLTVEDSNAFEFELSEKEDELDIAVRL